MKPVPLFAFVFFLFATLLRVKCIKKSPQGKYPHLASPLISQHKEKSSGHEYAFIGIAKRKYDLSHFRKNKITTNDQHVVKKQNNVHVLYLHDWENGKGQVKNNHLNTKDKKWWSKVASKLLLIFNRNCLTRFLCVGTFCLALYPVYTSLVNKKIELAIMKNLKENFLYVVIPPKIKRYIFSISFGEFRSSPFFLSTILVASYSLYIIFKVYIEKKREAIRMKSAIEAYNKSRDEYINTGRDSSEGTDHDADYFDYADEGRHFREDSY
ncbi:conserved Plasmodium protein, unknown function [Plasmodium knowlesi strain H]|uniref:Variable surface protein n=3 Tax=Plasmodium knowlesi TaxID=5850 RepID=A0A5K1UIU5_PLAKH|nr:conserved Plasmodium protein, unknown function [Plasmodium knowlesi strain H]OTN64976.1 Uncharacterized protein PKNOH_S120139500 [Plasmodium knowlesi]CAA9988252.1 conserved Plasmodium protein, unknown function [Plasmodium knowlesi strain H]SBO20184.1 conserved Plasmodium protein, unknown function [Plasmodium knowlesi strain H]SBO20478.1 conserved Plasmodium protein, unknown function [Plasmodium knowlesi strain H]VVS77726.1 conserved Plasmodium protein, unknown function [Plasmodium knowlesi |eukprot:XP_002259229.1 hypothetical protein, conserved in Plasmodium species [Plasmodium knowlesi strain H]